MQVLQPPGPTPAHLWPGQVPRAAAARTGSRLCFPGELSEGQPGSAGVSGSLRLRRATGPWGPGLGQLRGRVAFQQHHTLAQGPGGAPPPWAPSAAQETGSGAQSVHLEALLHQQLHLQPQQTPCLTL